MSSVQLNKMEKVLKELSALSETANTDLNGVPFATRSSMAIAVNEAKKRVEEISKEYKEMLASRSFTIFTEGAQADQATFARIAQEEGEVVVVSSQELYERLAINCDASLGATRQFGGTALNHLIRAVEEVATESGTGRLTTAPRLEDIEIAKTMADVVAVVRSIILKDTGTNLNKDYIEHLAFERAFKMELSVKVIPIVVTNNHDGSDFSLQERMFTGRGFVVSVPSSVDKEFVLNTFKRVISEVNKAKKQ